MPAKKLRLRKDDWSFCAPGFCRTFSYSSFPSMAFRRNLLLFTESVISRIPLARTFYISVKQVVQTFFFTSRMKEMKRVVLVEYPRKGCHAVAFVTGVTEAGNQQNVTDRRLFSLFVPTTPNPTSGIYIMVPEQDFEELDISVEDAFRLIISAGLSQNNLDAAEQGKKDD